MTVIIIDNYSLEGILVVLGLNRTINRIYDSLGIDEDPDVCNLYIILMVDSEDNNLDH